MTSSTLRHVLLSLILGLYNAVAAVGLALLMWRNHIWNERKWAAPKGSGLQFCNSREQRLDRIEKLKA